MTTDLVANRIFKWRRDWIWPVAVAGIIVWASNHGRVATPDFTHRFENFDKVVHFSVFGLLGTLIVRLGVGRWAPWVSILMVSAFGATDEWHQSFVPGRSCDLNDWLADTSGAALAVALYWGWGWYRQLLEGPMPVKASAVDDAVKAK